jgi:hypothetical protein
MNFNFKKEDQDQKKYTELKNIIESLKNSPHATYDQSELVKTVQ